MSEKAFRQPTNLTQRELGVVRACVRSIRSTDEVDKKLLAGLSDTELSNIYQSNVVRSIISGDLGDSNLGAFAVETLAREVDRIIRRDEIALQERRDLAQQYSSNDTFGLF